MSESQYRKDCWTFPIVESDFVIIGGGLAGLAAADTLGSRAIVLEAESRPGGLVRTERFGDYWFDRVIHLLYFGDSETETWVKSFMGPDLQPCRPSVWVETQAGTVAYPFQQNLADLNIVERVKCLTDLARATYGSKASLPTNYEEMLCHAFGERMSELFFFPYNRKMWRRPLNTLASSGFHWNIAQPCFEQVLRFTLGGKNEATQAYNSHGYYPCPPIGGEIRGMEYLAQKLSQRIHDLRLSHKVLSVDLEAHVLLVETPRGKVVFKYRNRCLTTIPLPRLVGMSLKFPDKLRRKVEQLPWNRVISVAVSIRGPRPEGFGHWRYYTDENFIFTRLVFLHEFDPNLAPSDGWPLLVEVTQRAEDQFSEKEILERVVRDVQQAKVLPEGAQIIDIQPMIIDPAYVVFTPGVQDIVNDVHQQLLFYGITPIGRYGKWEYSSMAQVMRDGRAIAKEQLAMIRTQTSQSVGLDTRL